LAVFTGFPQFLVNFFQAADGISVSNTFYSHLSVSNAFHGLPPETDDAYSSISFSGKGHSSLLFRLPFSPFSRFRQCYSVFKVQSYTFVD
jgi:hypothetical protein